MTDYYSDIRVLIDPEQAGETPDGGWCQDVSVILTDDSDRELVYWMTPAAITLSADQARELAFELLVCAEHADRIGERA
ncbi:MAG: hypothetical protein ACREB5_05750 [Sphingomonadaceae bacterium]